MVESSCPLRKLKIGDSASELSSFRNFSTGSSSVKVNTTIPFTPKFVSPPVVSSLILCSCKPNNKAASVV